MSGLIGTRSSGTSTLDSRRRLRPSSATQKVLEEMVLALTTEYLVDLMFLIRRELHQREQVPPRTSTDG